MGLACAKEKSPPYRPCHAHNERWWLKKGEIAECQVERLNAELAKVVTAPDSRDRLIAGRFEPMTGTPQRFGEFIKSETARYARVIKQAKIELRQ